MKKGLYLISALTIGAIALTACGKSAEKSPDSPLQQTESNSEPQQNTEFILEDHEPQPDPLAPTEAKDSSDEAAVTEPDNKGSDNGAAEEASESEQSQSDPFGNGAFEYDAYGAVVFNQDYTTFDDSVLMSAAQALFRSACNTNWSYFVGCPYSIDTESYVENEFGWQYFLINDGVTSSLADVKSDYNRVFSNRYPDNLDEVYRDGENGVYALGGSRGMDIFYDYSEVASLDSQSGDELFFTINNHYTGTYDSEEPYYESVTFSVVVGDDGIWRAGQFTLPY